MALNFLAEECLDAVDWRALRTMSGSATGVPQALRRLAEAQTEEVAHAAYWSLDNEVVVQGQLFEAAAPVVSVLLALLEGKLSGPARHRIVELLLQIAAGEPDETEVQRGNVQLGNECRRLVREGLWTVYGLLLSSDARTRDRAVEIVDTVDLDRRRLRDVLTIVSSHDADETVRSLARRLRSKS